ncbi:hypothetical protein ACLMJK_008700 [Lecanora helva]
MSPLSRIHGRNASQLNLLKGHNEPTLSPPVAFNWNQRITPIDEADFTFSRSSSRHNLCKKSFDQYVLVMLDGNSHRFPDERIKQGFDGGRQTAADLHHAVRNHLKRCDLSNQQELEIIIISWCDDEYVIRDYVSDRIIPSPELFFQFRTGFYNSGSLTANQLISISDKDKVKAHFVDNLKHSDCQRIIFAESTFGPFKEIFESLSKESPTLLPLVDKIDPTFRSDLFKPHIKILRNKDGKRIDRHFHIPDNVVRRVKDMQPRLCNNHYLRDGCDCFMKYGKPCGFTHDPITYIDRIILEQVAREQPCRKGQDCSDPRCWAGHRCLLSSRCDERCRFNKDREDMHFKDVDVVNVEPKALRSMSAEINAMNEQFKDLSWKIRGELVCTIS